MRITLVAANGYLHDRRARVLRWTLEQAGHDVTVVAAGSASGQTSDAVWVPTRRPEGAGKLGALARRAQPEVLRAALMERGLRSAVEASGPQVVVPTTVAALGDSVAAARAADAVVVADPRFEVPDDVSAVEIAPSRPDVAPGVSRGLPHHTPGWAAPVGTPTDGRHAGRRILLAYRRTDSNPGRYLEDALQRAGVDVTVVDRVDTGQLPEGLDGIVFVEGPYPALSVVGPPLDVPVLFWAHHGEHHLDANMRLAQRYRADHVLLAHSWHLSHRFPQPVTRFPFGVPVHRIAGDLPWAQRDHDVAMVGAHLDGGGPYARRGELVGRARDHLGAGHCAFLEGVTAAEMAAAYERSRIIINEGGTRHFPITMRVFEAIAAGALLLTDHVPGLDQLFDRDEHMVTIREPYEQQLDTLLADPTSETIARAALASGVASHTYDHRVDELFAVLDATTPAGAEHRDAPPTDSFSGLLHHDVEVQRAVQLGADELADEHPDRELWDVEELGDRLQPTSFEVAIVRTQDVTGHRELLRSARRFLYVEGTAAGLEEYLEEERPDATVESFGAVRRVDLGAPSYSIKPHEVLEP